MADRDGEQRELVYCHSCGNEWHRDEHGLQCPGCESEFVEVIEHDHDPRENEDENENEMEDFFAPAPSSPRQHPLHDHNPWDEEAPDPDEGDIDHVEWHGNGVHFSRTSYRSPPPGLRRPGQGGPDILSQLLMQTLANQPTRGGVSEREGRASRSWGPLGGNRYDQSRENRLGANFSGPTNPLQEGPGMQGLGGTFTASTSLRSRDPNGRPQPDLPFEDLHGLLHQLMGGFTGTMVVNGNNVDGTPSPLHFLSQILSPANSHHGDAVYTQEALDRVITQLMEQHNTSSAPGPASAAAIAALPKAKVDKSMLGSDGKAECSVCMDNVDIGDEITMLPCKHWFHGECVGAWLKEHDTCPHCRQSITPKDGDSPRTPEQTPRRLQNPWNMPPMPPGSGSRQRPIVVNDPAPPAGSSSSRPSTGRRPSNQSGNSGGGSGGGGIAGWMSRHLGGGGHGN